MFAMKDYFINSNLQFALIYPLVALTMYSRLARRRSAIHNNKIVELKIVFFIFEKIE